MEAGEQRRVGGDGGRSSNGGLAAVVGNARSGQTRVYELVGQRGRTRAVVAVAYYVVVMAALAPLLPLRRQTLW